MFQLTPKGLAAARCIQRAAREGRDPVEVAREILQNDPEWRAGDVGSEAAAQVLARWATLLLPEQGADEPAE